MKRWSAVGLWVCLGCMAMGSVDAATPASQDTQYQRGEFHFSVGPPRAFVQVRTIPAQWDPRAPGANDDSWRFWLLDSQIDRRTGADHEYFDYAYEARTAANLGDAGRVQVEFNPEYQQLVVHRVELRRDGVWQDRLAPDRITLARRESNFEKDVSDGRVTALIVLDDVRKDDVVRVSYTITGSNPILAGQLYDGRRLGWTSPILDSHLRVQYDPGTKVRTQADNGAQAAQVRTVPGAVEVSFDAHAQRPVVDEQSYPAWYRPFPRVEVGPDRSWADVVNWALPLFPAVRTLPPDLEARIAEWSKLPDPTARLNAALRVVQDDIRYFGVEIGDSTHRPADPSVTWQRRYGDCKDKAYLLATVLNRMGIAAVPALVSTDRGRGVRDDLPAASAFNHAIVRATIDGAALYVDPTIPQQGGDPREGDLVDYGAALPVAPGTRALETITPVRMPKAGITSIERLQPSDDGSVRMDIETTFSGDSADDIRRMIAQARIDDLQRRKADYYRQRYGPVDVNGTMQVRDDRASNRLAITESYVLKSPWLTENGARSLDVFAEALDEASALPPSMARTGPLAIGTPGEYRHEVHVTLPAGWKSLLAKENEAFSSSAFGYTRELSPSAEKLDLVYALQVKQRELDATAATAHLGELRRMRDTLGARLRFAAPPVRIESRERDARLKALLRDVMDNGGSK
ncbi:DUF3857 domain-containing transglutaminase family protein [Lysobacter sp. KIS68-7]|uniref:DUF3857 domain-containing transglutaminase family protein n=1 Tax=Lysobacter sp. KIS68-7 TaxID=2904252 RepID=UPI001E4AB7A1|nr:DUF3857 domain-containing transglutaminase family protein [Lysobacter sp. KIS68-7]UHQ20885.1 DUF3857 domain-containing transglutaminase family protein [Lysobacter sp. KIS68-7]